MTKTYTPTKRMNNTTEHTYKMATRHKFAHINIRSMRNKFPEVEDFLQRHTPKVLAVTEHWLTRDELQLYLPEAFVIGGSYCREKMIHGGSLIYVQKGVDYKQLEFISQMSEEGLLELAGVHLSKLDCIVISVYRTDKMEARVFIEQLCNVLNRVRSLTLNLLIMGDVNLDCMDSKDPIVLDFLNMLRCFNLKPYIKQRTRYASCRTVDNIFCNMEVDSPEVYTCFSSDHMGVGVTWRTDKPAGKTVLHSFRPINNMQNRKGCWLALGQVDWSTVTMINNFEESFRCFWQIFLQVFDLYFPIQQRKIKFGTKITSSEEIDTAARDLQLLLDLRKVGNSENLRNEIRSARKKYRKSIHDHKLKLNREYIENANNMTKACWDIVKKETKRNINNEVCEIDPESLNSHFVETPRRLVQACPKANYDYKFYLQMAPGLSTSMFLYPITKDELLDIIHSIKSSNATDVYGMSANLFKDIGILLVDPLCHILNLAFSEGCFPNELKLCKVIPLFKKGDKKDLDCYRPVTITPILSKVFEIAFLNRLKKFFRAYKVIAPSQFGYQDGISINDLMYKIMKTIYNAFEDKTKINMVLCDLSKAFDTIDHTILLEKLRYFGVKGIPLDFCKDFLMDRSQCVVKNGKISSQRNVTMGVPQGSVLGPLLFILYVNDMYYCVNRLCVNVSNYQLADDTSFISHCDISSLVNMLNIFYDYFNANLLILNVNKNQCMTFELAGDSNKESVKFLGYHLDGSLQWKTHVDVLCKKCSKLCFVLYKLKNILDLNVLRIVYLGLFQGTFSYGIMFWGHSVSVDKLMIIQKRAIRTIFGKKKSEHCKPLFQKLKVMTIPAFYIYTMFKYIKENVTQFSKMQDLTNINTRQCDNLYVPLCKKSKTMTSPEITCIKLYNMLGSEAKRMPVTVFLSRLKGRLEENPMYSVKEYMDKEFWKKI